jgi:hypothetical protein
LTFADPLADGVVAADDTSGKGVADNHGPGVPLEVARVERAAGQHLNIEWFESIDVNLLEVGADMTGAGLRQIWATTSRSLILNG